MGAITEIFRSFSPAYQAAFPNLPEQHKKALQAITNCRSGEYGATVYRCAKCGMDHMVYRSCGNRHCPQCQYTKAQQWLNKQLQKQLPTHYFMITFTVPSELRAFIRSNQRVAYNAMFKASAKAMKLLAADSRFIGANLTGFTGILHTWGRQLQYHPHIHYIVPGGGIDTSTNQWQPAAVNFFVPVKALSRIYRAKFLNELQAAGLLSTVAPEIWKKEWNVNSQPVGAAEASLKYLTPYVFRVAISDSRIIAVKGRLVTFSYRVKKSNRPRKMNLDAFEFIRRYLQHTLPSGFMKVRHFGLMSANCALSIARIRALILDRAADLAAAISGSQQSPPEKYPHPRCPACDGLLVYLKSIIPARPLPAPG